MIRVLTGALVAVTLSSVYADAHPLSAQQPSERPFWRPVVMGTYGMVAAEHPLEAVAGMDILRAGGNAFDAAAAVFYMTTVVEQHQAAAKSGEHTTGIRRAPIEDDGETKENDLVAGEGQNDPPGPSS